MVSKNSTGIKSTAVNGGVFVKASAAAFGAQGPEVDFNDTIARNRRLNKLDLAAVGYAERRGWDLQE